MKRVAVIAEHPVMRAGLVALLERNGYHVATAAASPDTFGDGAAPIAGADVVLIHLTRQVDAFRPVFARQTSAPVVALLDDVVESPSPVGLLDAGARAVLAHDATEEEIVAAVDAVAAGLVALSERLAEPMLARQEAQSVAEEAPELTPRERQVLGMVAEGLPNKIIAARLGISEHTVKTHLAALFEKLGVGTRAEAVARGARLGLLLL